MDIIEIHPDNPQPRLVKKVVEALRGGAVVAIPTDSGYAIVSTLGNKEGLEKIRHIRDLDEKHNFSFLCESFSQLGDLVVVNNAAFRAIKAVTPGAYTFILPATKKVPRITWNKKKKTVGVRLPDHKIAQDIVKVLGEPALCSTLILPGDTDPLRNADDVVAAVGSQVDLVVDGPVGEGGATTVVSFENGYPEVVRQGAGDTSLFE